MALLHVGFFSNVLGLSMQMDVILPQRTAGQVGMEGAAGGDRIKTLYLLHGMSDDHTIWQRRTSIERYATELGIAVVMPSVHLSWNTDMHRGGKYWTYVAEELPAICRSFFPQMSDRREDNYVAGLSMGGYGAMKLGLRAAGTFSKAAALSGALDLNSIMGQRALENRDFWEGIFGPAEQVPGSFNDLFAAAEELKASGNPLPDLYIWCGTEDFLYAQNTAMREHLRKLGYRLTYEESPGDHQWKYWDEKIQTVLNWIMAK
ncbi:MAG: esterase family protein [Clostridiales bacterium]|nr:esterase family protein [Clostridiales bacterium]